jgi:ElaB/YqjD/DUF883 family membrane-anchored ribosome-binding protein
MLSRSPMNNGNGNTNTANEKLGAIKDKVKGLVDQGEEKVDQIKHKVIEVKDQAVTRGSSILGRVESFIKANPLKAVGIAFGVGYVGMRLFRR